MKEDGSMAVLRKGANGWRIAWIQTAPRQCARTQTQWNGSTP